MLLTGPCKNVGCVLSFNSIPDRRYVDVASVKAAADGNNSHTPVISARSDRGDRGCFQIGVAALLVKSVEQADSPFAVFLHQLFGEHLIFHLGKHGVSVAGAAITSYGAFLWKAGYANLGGIVVGIGITEILLTTLKWII